jgi:hypothetical protein
VHDDTRTHTLFSLRREVQVVCLALLLGAFKDNPMVVAAALEAGRIVAFLAITCFPAAHSGALELLLALEASMFALTTS